MSAGVHVQQASNPGVSREALDSIGMPGKGWFPILRIYGPLQAWFDKTWRPGDIHPNV